MTTQDLARAGRVLAAAALVGLAALVGPSGAADAATDDDTGTLTWGLVPADAAGVPDGRQSFRAAVDPGASVTEHAVLTNYAEREVTFDLTASDGIIAEDGSFDILQDDEEPQDGGAWITVQDQVTVGPETSVLVPFRIAVPADATPGDHPAGLTAGIAAGSLAEDGTAVGLQARVGLRLHLRVTGELAPAVAARAPTVGYRYSWNPFAPGTVTVATDVSNTGNVRLGVAGSVTAAGPFGAGATSAGSPAAQEMLPGTTRSLTQVIEGVWPLVRLSTTITATPGAVGEDDLGDAALRTVTVTGTTWVVPWPQLVLLALVVLAVQLLARLRRRRRRALADALARARAEGAAQVLATAGPRGSEAGAPPGSRPVTSGG